MIIKNFLSYGFKRKNGRNRMGTIIFRTRGSQNMNLYRFLDYYLFLSYSLPYFINSYCYSSFHHSFIMLLVYANGVLSYRIGIQNIKYYSVYNNFYPSILNGGVYLLSSFNIGMFVCNIPFFFCNKVGLARASGMSFQFIKSDLKLNLGLLRLKLKKKYILSLDTILVYGRVSNIDKIELTFGKAGLLRNLGFRPIVRGIARNPVDHPNGGRTPGGKVYRSFSFLISRSSKKTSRSSYKNYFLKNKYIFNING